jgi:hypothetical protein
MLEASKLYIAVLDEFPDYMAPTLVAHTVLGYHLKSNQKFSSDNEFWFNYRGYLVKSFKKVTVKVNQKEFNKIVALEHAFVGHENTTLDGRDSCAIWLWNGVGDLPNVLKFAKLWKPTTN